MHTTTPAELSFRGTIHRDDHPGGWTYVLVPGSSEHFGTRRPVKVEGTMDGHGVAATLMPMGDGTHMLPIRAALRSGVAKDHGDEVDVRIAPASRPAGSAS